MARLRSAFRAGFKSLASVAQNDLPAKGSKVRACYDYLFENRGLVVELPYPAYMIDQLNDFYGCEIDRKRGCRPMKVQLLGEWRGEEYLDYRGTVRPK
jgi:hypothetical protein